MDQSPAPSKAQVAEKTWKRALLLLFVAGAGMVAGALLLASILAGQIYDYQDTVDGVHLPPVDAIVVLAGGRGRIAAAADLWYRYWEMVHEHPLPHAKITVKVPILYVSGMGHRADWNVFAHQIRRGVLQIIQPKDVVLENESTNTEENAIWLGKYAIRKNWHRVLLLTSSYHMMRSRLVLGKVLHAMDAQVAVETLSLFQDPFEPEEWRSSWSGYRITIFEYLKCVYYRYLWNPERDAAIRQF